MSRSFRISKDFEKDPYHLFVRSVPDLVVEARSAAVNQASSYRGFLVGGVMMASSYAPTGYWNGIPNFDDKDFELEVKTVTAANTKVLGKEKVCTEKKLKSKIQRTGLRPRGMVLSATSDMDLIEGVTGFATHVLWPCAPCQNEVISDLPDDMLIVGSGLDKDVMQVALASDLRRMIDEDDALSLMGLPVVDSFAYWNRRVKTYEELVKAEISWAPEPHRSLAQLAQMALLS